MQQYQVPQFINIEDRIVGPLTLKQFLYLLGAAAVILVGWGFLYLPLFILLALPPAAFFVALAFVKINERPLPTIVMGAINFYLRPRLYLWQKQTPKKEAPSPLPLPTATAPLPKLTESKLADLAWSLDVHERTGSR